MKNLFVFVFILISALTLDLWSKKVIENTLSHEERHTTVLFTSESGVQVMVGVGHFQHRAGWRLLPGTIIAIIFLLLGIILAVFTRNRKMSFLGCAGVAGGSLGNMINLAQLGYAVDWIVLALFHDSSEVIVAANIADCAIVFGTFLFLLGLKRATEEACLNIEKLQARLKDLEDRLI